MSNPSSALTIYAGINLVVFQCCGKQVLPTSDRHVLFKIPWLDKESVGGGGRGVGEGLVIDTVALSTPTSSTKAQY